MKEFPIIETKNLILRDLRMTDYDNYYDYVSDEDIKKQFWFDFDEEACKSRLEELVSKYSNEYKPFTWAICKKENDELVGIISLYNISFDDKNFSVSYGIRKKHRNNNYAYEACIEIINFMFNNMDMHRLEIAHRVGNIGSEKTIKKLGAVYEGTARESKFYDNEFQDRKIYSILKKEWGK